MQLISNSIKELLSLVLLTGIFFAGFILKMDANNLIASYSFDSGTVIDEAGNSKLFLRNKAVLYEDAERGKTIRFRAEDKSYAVFNSHLLDGNSRTIAFFLYWESANSRTWHQLFEVHDPTSNSNLFFTPQIAWGNQGCAIVSDSRDYDLYESFEGATMPKDQWTHIAITIENKLVSIYQDGVKKGSHYLNIPPYLINADSLFLGGNPYRTNNFYISARLDEIKVFDKALAANQIQALSNETEIPEPEFAATSWETSGNALNLTIDLASKKQTIQNFGSSDGWNTERIGKYWPEDIKEKLAELLFSTEKDEHGNPKGIGLSGWRFNIGAGTAEQGDASRISRPERRTEGFLSADGATYDWNKQEGQQWFLRKANEYNVHHIIGWQNSPPVAYTDKNLGFREYGAPMSTILKTEYFDDFAVFLANVVDHFNEQGIKFDYISPLNEPQYGWAPSSYGGTVTQEGTPWTNQDIFDVVTEIDKEFIQRNINTKVFITEAASINKLTGGTGHADNQLPKFWNVYSGLSLLGKPSFSNIVSYHSYFNDYGSQLVNPRVAMLQAAQNMSPKPEFWQTEYSLLSDGYRSGYPDGYKLSEMETALSMARVILSDLNYANVASWSWWTTFEAGKHGQEARFCLIEAITKADNSSGDYYANKLFYSFGNFSHFVRPGMTRLGIQRSDNLSALQESSDIMFSAFTNSNESKLVVVAANITDEARAVNLNLMNASDKTLINQKIFLTDAYSNLALQEIDLSDGNIIVPAKSVLTVTADIGYGSSVISQYLSLRMKTRYSFTDDKIINSFSNINEVETLRLYSITGELLDVIKLDGNSKQAAFSATNLAGGTYLVVAEGNGFRKIKKVVVNRQ